MAILAAADTSTCILALASFAAFAAARAEAGETIAIEAGRGVERQTLQVTAGSGASFADCSDERRCPQMLVVPSSAPGFKIGSPEGEAERVSSETQHSVAIRHFAIGKYEVSVRQYMACVTVAACRPPEWAEPGGTHNITTGAGVTYKSLKPSIGSDDQPVVGISWDDAMAYVKWLSAETGHTYRLPSEAEWEYAARAGTTTRFWWGDNTKRGGEVMACCRGCGSERDASGLFEVGAFKPNAWGLHNVHGNVWEWVADYYCERYASGPSDGQARTERTCPGEEETPEGLRTFRGGSCFYEPRQMRAAMRLRNWPDFRNQTVGFRIARELP